MRSRLVAAVAWVATQGVPEPVQLPRAAWMNDETLAVVFGLPALMLGLTWFALRWSIRAMR